MQYSKGTHQVAVGDEPHVWLLHRELNKLDQRQGIGGGGAVAGQAARVVSRGIGGLHRQPAVQQGGGSGEKRCPGEVGCAGQPLAHQRMAEGMAGTIRPLSSRPTSDSAFCMNHAPFVEGGDLQQRSGECQQTATSGLCATLAVQLAACTACRGNQPPQVAPTCMGALPPASRASSWLFSKV